MLLLKVKLSSLCLTWPIVRTENIELLMTGGATDAIWTSKTPKRKKLSMAFTPWPILFTKSRKLEAKMSSKVTTK